MGSFVAAPTRPRADARGIVAEWERKYSANTLGSWGQALCGRSEDGNSVLGTPLNEEAPAAGASSGIAQWPYSVGAGQRLFLGHT